MYLVHYFVVIVRLIYFVKFNWLENIICVIHSYSYSKTKQPECEEEYWHGQWSLKVDPPLRVINILRNLITPLKCKGWRTQRKYFFVVSYN